MRFSPIQWRSCISFCCLATVFWTAEQVEGQLFFRARNYNSAASGRNNNAVSAPNIAAPAGPVSATQLSQSIEKAIAQAGKSWDTSESRSPWGVMHNILAWGIEGEILLKGKPRNSITCLCENQTLKSVKLLSVENGKLVPVEGPGLQGHPGQFLAVLAQNQISTEQPIVFDGHQFTVNDLIDYEKQNCRTGLELTFKLMSLCHYCGTDAQWTNAQGETWNVERLLQEELRQPINGVTCGGTHRLMAIGMAVARRKREEQPMEGVWQTAVDYLSDYHDYTFTLFNPDGSFSTEWFERRGALNDPQKRLQTTGHVLEWLVVTCEADEMTSERMRRSMYYLSRLLQSSIGEEWSVGPKAHAIRAMRLYQQRLAELDESNLEATVVAENAQEVDDAAVEPESAVSEAVESENLEPEPVGRESSPEIPLEGVQESVLEDNS